MPDPKSLIEIALVFNDGKKDVDILANMSAMCQFIIDRLYENGNISEPSSKEQYIKK